VFAIVYAGSFWVWVMMTPVDAVSLGVGRGALVVQVRKPVTEVERLAFGVASNVPRRVEIGRAEGGGGVWWFRGIGRLRHYLRNDPEMQASDWMQAGNVGFSGSGWQSYTSPAPSGPVSLPVMPGVGVAPWLPLTVEVPLWVLLVVVGVPWALGAAVRARRRRLGSRCVACGYDLRATAGGVCPECGAGRLPRGAL
jgi:hypothetical protein